MRSFGIMQGRLTPSNGRGIQFFPFDNWEKEFEVGATIGIDEIEWIFDYDKYTENPLWSKEGLQSIRERIAQSGVTIQSVCFDYFMRHPFFKQGSTTIQCMRDENIEFVHRVAYAMKEIGATLLEIPLVDDSSIKTKEERKQVIDFLHEILPVMEELDILVGCETDMPVGVFRDFLEEINHRGIRANYDSGNSSGLGYDHADEINSLGSYIANVHIKDRVQNGGTVPLGTGGADFDKVFSTLKNVDYKGSFILQAARGEDGFETQTISSQLAFVKKYCIEYNLE